jgi:hypothetical protein
MAETNLNNNADITGFDAGPDSVTIVNYIDGIPGGRSLNVTGFTPKAIRAGHVVIKETATGDYKPMPVGNNSVASFGSITGGSSGATNGNYNGIALLGGSGSGVIASVGVTGNAVTDIGVEDGGAGYQAGDTLTAFAGGVSFSVTVSAVNAAGYGSLPAGHEYEGILINSILTKRPFAGILVCGTVNPAAAPYPMDMILTDIKSALPLIDFRED